MTLQLYGHPFSSYTWKALIALRENGNAFAMRALGPDGAENLATLKQIWPIAKFPVLVDDDLTIMEASAIIEYLEVANGGRAHLIPQDAIAAVEARMLDRIFDSYVMNQMQVFVDNRLRAPERRRPWDDEAAATTLDTIYVWLEARLDGRVWAVGDAFSIADCAAAPALFYADWVHPIPEAHARLRAYRQRLLARPSIKATVDEARPYRDFFPLGAPDRD